jgi:glycosyltransferase involved in cell wall biosynthesis
MKILHCVATFGGGGAERQLSYLAPEMKRRGVDVGVAFKLLGPNFDRVERAGVNLHKIQSSDSNDPRSLVELVALFRREKPDVVFTWLPQMDVLAGTASVLTRTPFVLCERSSAPGYSNDWKSSLRRRVGRRAAAVVANSRAGMELWNVGPAGAPCYVIPNGVPLGEIDSIAPDEAEPPTLAPDAEMLLYAGRYIASKNPLALLRAFDRVLAARPHAVAVLHGQGPLEAPMHELHRQLEHRDRIRIYGFTRKLWHQMKRARLFVSISDYEGNPNTVIEAVASGRPVVISDIAEHREFLDDNSAWMVKGKAPDGIAAAILRALDEPAVSSDKVHLARERIERFSVETMATRYLELADNLARASA